MAADHEPKPGTAAEQAARIESKLDLNFQLTHGWTAEQVEEVVAAKGHSKAQAALIAQYVAEAGKVKAALAKPE